LWKVEETIGRLATPPPIVQQQSREMAGSELPQTIAPHACSFCVAKKTSFVYSVSVVC
jgi:hypothetical protein